MPWYYWLATGAAIWIAVWTPVTLYLLATAPEIEGEM